MRSQTFQVQALRGMDQRWQARPNFASLITDMTWDPKDGWKDCGGFDVVNYTEIAGQGDEVLQTNPFTLDEEITSIHWFSQHNGARQWLLWETEGQGLVYFDGSNANDGNDPWTNIVDASGTNVTRHYMSSPWQKTQSQAWGGRLYLVNGYDEPAVFDGRKIERAGYAGPPAAPQATALSGMGFQGSHASIFITNGSADVPKMYIDLIGLGLGPQNSDIASIVSETLEDAFGNLVSLVAGTTVKGQDSNRRRCGYRYKVTFLNSRGQESPASPPSNTCVFDNGGTFYDQDTMLGDDLSFVNEDGRTFVKLELPLGGDEVVARRIYRTRNIYDATNNMNGLGYADHFYLLDQIEDNCTTLTEDGLPDAMLGPLLDELDFGVFP